jgi:hypothetical protein
MSMSGAACAVMSKPHYPSNAWLLTAPLVCWLLRQRQGAAAAALVGAAAVASLAFVAATPAFGVPGIAASVATDMSLAIGFKMWVGAHALITVALLTPVYGRNVEREQLDREFAELHRRWTSPDPAGAPSDRV